MTKLPQRLAEPGPIIDYLESIRATAARAKAVGNLQAANELSLAVETAEEAVRKVFSTPEGAILMDLLEKSTMLSFREQISETGALGARNAQSFIALDLRRIVSNERTELENRAAASAGRRDRNRRSDR